MLTKRRPGRPTADDPGAPSPLGRRIRQARQELGLSLAAVAGSDFSRAFLNQIELGRAQPSTQNLRIIARRLQRPIDYFLEEPGDSAAALELALAEAEMSLLHGEGARAESLVARMLARTIPIELRTRAQLTLAVALMKQGRPQEAKPVLEEAIVAAERLKWHQLLVELYDRLGSVYYFLRRPHAAGQWFDRALERYESASVADPVLKARVLGHRANLHYVAGQPIETIPPYESAIAAAARGGGWGGALSGGGGGGARGKPKGGGDRPAQPPERPTGTRRLSPGGGRGCPGGGAPRVGAPPLRASSRGRVDD